MRADGRFLVLLGALALLGAGCVRTSKAPEAPPQGGIYRSDDGGVTFQQKVTVTAGGNLARIRPREAVAVPTRPGTVYVVAEEGLFRTTSSGEDWTRVAIPARAVLSLSVHPTNQDALVAAVTSIDPPGRGKLLKSADGGRTWADAFVAPSAEEERGTLVRRRQEVPTIVTSVAFNPARPETVLASTSTGTLFSSDDGLVHWRTLRSFQQGITAVKFSPTVPDLLFVRLENGRLARSTDGGTTATAVPIRRPLEGPLDVEGAFSAIVEGSEVVHALLFLPTGTPGSERILTGTDNGLFASTDSGEHWTPLPLPPTGRSTAVPITSLAASADGTLWAISGFVLFSSTDGGQTWRTRESPLRAPIRFVVTDPSNPQRLYILFAR